MQKDEVIYRQAAIEIIQSMYPGMPRVPWMRKDWQKRYEPYIRMENAIRKLPSAEPEIIRCKDCKHWDTTWQNDWAPNYHYCPMIDGTRRDDFYCADAERRADE